MTNLAEHWDGGYLKPGWHDVTIKGCETFTNPNNGNPGVKFACVDAESKSVRASFWLTQASLVFLADFARDCGMTRDQCRSYNPDNPNSHRVLIGKRVRLKLVPNEKDDKYCDVDQWEPISKDAPALPPPANETTTQGAQPLPGFTPDPMLTEPPPMAEPPAAGANIPF